MHYFEVKIGLDKYIVIANSRKKLEIARNELLKQAEGLSVEATRIRKTDLLVRKIKE